MSEAISQPPAPALLFGLDGAPTDKARRPRKTSAAKEAALAEHLPPNLGKPLKVAVSDFSNPNRPKTCLEIDFPLVPINALSALEGNAGKPIYQMSKWWARRRSCVFRALLLAAAMEAPVKKHPDGQPMLGPDGKPIIDEDAADQAVWDAYYANHQAAGNFKHLKVLDPFMGGGTTLVEGSRLGFQVTGVDLNPVAWFIVKNELACTDPNEVKAFFDQIEAEVKPQIQPFYVTDGVGGRKGTWFRSNAGGSRRKMPADFDPITLPPDQRKGLQYEGPEVIYTFWAKHGPCIKPGCGHRTPIFRSPIVATKKLGVKYIPCTCKNKACGITFHAELGDARIAPDAEHIVLENEHPYTVLSAAFTMGLLSYSKGTRDEQTARIRSLYESVEKEPGFRCPRCGTWSGQTPRDILNTHHNAKSYSEIDKKHLGIVPARNVKKPVYCTLLIDPDWLKGSPGECDGKEIGGFIDAPIEATEVWYRERLQHLRLIEVRGMAREAAPDAEEQIPTTTEEGVAAEDRDDAEGGKTWVPAKITLRDGRQIETGRGTVPKRSTFVCQACGMGADILTAVETSGRSSPMCPYLLHVYDPQREAVGHPYNGRFFKVPTADDIDQIIAASREWEKERALSLSPYWPRELIPPTKETTQHSLQSRGYTHWWMLFDPRQLLGHARLLLAITTLGGMRIKLAVRLQALGAHQQYLRNQCMLSFWNLQGDKPEPHFSGNNYHPKQLVVENCVFQNLGRGNFTSCAEGVVEGLQWAQNPWEVALGESGHDRLATGDPIKAEASTLYCGSSTDLSHSPAEPYDLVITDPPFGNNVFYADLADFFYVWLACVKKPLGLDAFDGSFSPRSLEAIHNHVEHPDDPAAFYEHLLTLCFEQAFNRLKDGGMMAFTFHHSQDEPWLSVLKSLFSAGFVLEATYPVQSDESKGEGGKFGSRLVEYDIIHVCRKRLEHPKPVSWPKMRQWVKAEMSRLRPLLESYKTRGLQDADVRVILRGKALEFYSRHYGTVIVSAPGGEDMVLSIRDALLGINQLLDELSGAPGERPPSIVQPVVYQYLRLFGPKASYSRDEVSKLLRGTAIQPRDFERTGSTPWIMEEDKVVRRVPIYARFQKMRQRPRRELKTELDQAHFLIGAAMPVNDGDTGVNIEKELERETFLIRPGVEALLDWYSKALAGTDEPDVPRAAGLALQLLRAAFEAKRARMQQEQPTLFEEWEASMQTVA